MKEPKMDMLTAQYENFAMKEGESIHDMYTKFSSIINELQYLGEPIHPSKQVNKILRILPKSWASKVDTITEAKNLKVLSIDALIGNLQTHEWIIFHIFWATHFFSKNQKITIAIIVVSFLQRN